MIPAVVREWHSDEGWGVIDSDQTPGGCWAHFSHLEMAGYKELTAGQHVALKWEQFDQDGFTYRAVNVIPASQLAWHANPPDGYETYEELPWEPPPDGSVIKLMPEFFAGLPLWGPDGHMFSEPEDAVRELGLSAGLANDLERWNTSWEEGGESDHRTAGEKLLERLNTELGHRYRFLYRP